MSSSLSRAAALLRDLIALPSVNPAFLPADDPCAGESRVADFLAATAASAGLSIEFQPVAPGRSNLLASLQPAGKIRQRVALVPHMDTVGGRELNPQLFTPVIKAGKLHGRGACDTKGSIAAMLTALMEVAVSGKRPEATEIVFAAVIDEENGQAGSRALVRSGFKADLAIVGEPTRLRVITAHKGDLWLKVETQGKAAHGARPELGKNAVHAMARIVDALETDYARLLKKRRHSVLGHPTVNVGSIRGGLQPNIVPSQCEISIDRRTIPGESEASVQREMKAFLQGRSLPCRVISMKGEPCDPMETDPKLPLVRQFLQTAKQAGAAGVDFFCDAAVLAGAGTPSVVFGPGDIAQAHTADEWISLRSLDSSAALLTRYLRSLP